MKKERISSFINEQTASYLLVPQFTAMLKRHFSKVIPIYYWATREGSSLGVAQLAGQNFTIVALYPRRPKLVNYQTDHVLVKINEQLFNFADLLAPAGIPVFAGSPMISSLNDLKNEVASAWFEIQPGGTEIQYRLDLPFDHGKHEFTLTEAEILELIGKEGRAISMDDFRKIIKEANSAIFPFFVYGRNVYKPVYFFIGG